MLTKLTNNVPYGLILLLCLLLPQVQASEPIQLPDLGESSAADISANDERRMGLATLQYLQRAGLLVTEPLLQEYVTALGYRLGAFTESNDTFTFFIVDDASINAFALPGGFIGINTGLINASRSESELAAVVAHEISHVTQHHLARRFEQAKGMDLGTAAALIAVILLGGENPQLAQAALATTTAISAQRQLDFSRENEHEADRVGIHILAAAGFEPRSMATFFERLREESRYNTSIPEFLSTHPVTESRISDALNRAMHYPDTSHDDSLDYSSARAIARVYSSHNLLRLIKELETEVSQSERHAEPAHIYSLALAHDQLGQQDKAVELLESLHKRYPERIEYIHSLAQVESRRGQDKVASALYKQGLRLYPGNTVLTLGHAEVLIQAMDFQQAQTILSVYLRYHQESARGYQLLAQAEKALGNTHAAYLAQAEYYYLNHELHSAIDQLTLALRDKTIDFYHASRLEARLKQVQKLVEEEPRN